ncbi:hypothetical protein DFH07DRAFT_351983 [Mycena maculata]|uniref:Uncharacterized protein n=1 Tax=Mycena maculata TaxID=230809 RepID=A0AAD7NMF1_9AGAR|nr:hypothetical protein DFH07DRAFT_351983 [Mycena maculata]
MVDAFRGQKVLSKDFQQSLTRIPHLRALKLDNLFPGEEDAGSLVSGLVLPGLETLELTGRAMICCAFLQSISLPRCRIRVVLDESLHHYVSPRSVWTALESQRWGADDPVICGLRFAEPTSGAPSFEVSFFNHPSKPPRYSVRLRAELPTLIPSWRDESNIMDIMSLDQITILTLKSKTLTLPASLLHLKHLRTMAFYHHIEPFIQQLVADPIMAVKELGGAGLPARGHIHLNRFGPVASVHYPGLREISFRHIAFGGGDIGLILSWLAQRKRLGFAINEVRLVGCNLTNADLDRLKEVVSRTYN